MRFFVLFCCSLYILLVHVTFTGLYIFICPIAIAYSMGQIIKSVCVCQCVCVSVRLWAL